MKIRSEIVIETHGRYAKVSVNGNELEGVQGYSLIQNADENGRYPILRLDLMATKMTIRTDAVPELPYPYTEYYTLTGTDDGDPENQG